MTVMDRVPTRSEVRFLGPPTDLAGLFRATADAQPDAPFLRFGARAWTYAEVAADARALAAAFQDVGVEKGDRIVVLLPNLVETVVTIMAAAELGALIVPINPQSSPRELRFVLRNTEAMIAVIAERVGEVEYLELFESMLPDLPSLQYLATVGEEDLWYDDRIFQFEDLVSAGRGLGFESVDVTTEDALAVLYTAGTSQKQKGVVLSHGNLLAAGWATASALGMSAADSTLCSVPLFNIFGLGATLLPTLVTGGSLILQEQFDAAEALDLIEAHGPTVLHGVPTMFVLMLRELGERPAEVESLRTGIIAGAPVAPELVRAIRRDLVPEVEIAYGLTESSSTVSITQPSDGDDRETSVGRPVAGVDIAILDADEHQLAIGQVGHIAIRGPTVMQGYFRQPATTRAAMTGDGFLRTGDLGNFDSAGFLHIVGRESDVILRGGYGVHPREVEDYLRSHPAVDEAVVVGVPNEVLGELICACVIPVEGALVSPDEIRQHCRPALAEYKLPDIVRFLEEFPHPEEGRSQRAELAHMMRLFDTVAEGEPDPAGRGDN
ncbi:MAG: acyl--CoA ligase [Gemmatimonadota bacterium]|nr:acyl--CoA ligase [Gemmatimonadota bacterium]